MPCNGVTVLNALTTSRGLEAIESLRPLMVGQPQLERATGLVRALLALPVGGRKLPAKVAIDSAGKVTIITTEGTFALGKEAISKLLAQLQVQGVNVSDLQWEQHTHTPNAPRLAYATNVRSN